MRRRALLVLLALRERNVAALRPLQDHIPFSHQLTHLSPNRGGQGVEAGAARDDCQMVGPEIHESVAHRHSQLVVLWWRRAWLVLVFGMFNTAVASLLGYVCKHSRSPWLRRRIGTWLNRKVGEHFAQQITAPRTSSARVVHRFGPNTTLLQCKRYGVHANDDDIFEQSITMTVVRSGEHVLVYNPIPLSTAQLREHVLTTSPSTHYHIVLPSVYHHMFVDAYLDVLPRERVSLVGSTKAGLRHNPPLSVQPASTLRMPRVQVFETSRVSEEISLLVPLSPEGCSGGALLLVCHLFQCDDMVQMRFVSRHWALRLLERAFKWISGFHDGGGLDLLFTAHLTDADDCIEAIRAMRDLEGVSGIVCAHGGLCSVEPRQLLRRHLSWL